MANDKNIEGFQFDAVPYQNPATVRKSRQEVYNDYEGFVEKFKLKKTTDDCYTPATVYDAVLGWLRENADIEGR